MLGRPNNNFQLPCERNTLQIISKMTCWRTSYYITLTTTFWPSQLRFKATTTWSHTGALTCSAGLLINLLFFYAWSWMKEWKVRSQDIPCECLVSHLGSTCSVKKKPTYSIASNHCGPVPHWSWNTQFPRFTYLSKAILKSVQSCVKICLSVFLFFARVFPCSMNVGKNVREQTMKWGNKTVSQKHVNKIR